MKRVFLVGSAMSDCIYFSKMATKRSMYELSQRSLTLQQRLYDTRVDVQWEEGQFVHFQLVLIRLVQILTSSLYEQQEEASLPLHAATGHVYETSHTPLLLSAMGFILQQLDLMAGQVDNFFGTIDMQIYRREIGLMMDYVESLVNCKSSETCPCMHHVSLFPIPVDLAAHPGMYAIRHTTAADEETGIHAHNHTPLDDLNCNSNLPIMLADRINPYHLFLCVFWFRCFQHKHSVSWSELSICFESVYDFHNSEVMDRFRRCMYSTLHGGVASSATANTSSSVFSQNTHMSNDNDEEEDADPSFSLISGASYQFAVAFSDMYRLASSPASTPWGVCQRLLDTRCVLVLAGQLVERKIEYLVPSPVRQLLGLQIAVVACGDQHICVITAEGKLYSWGKGLFGRLGHGSQEDCKVPTLLDLSQRVPMKHVGCAFAFTGAVSRSGRLYTWGAGINGRLGTGNGDDQLLPVHIRDLDKEHCVSFHAGSVHSCVLTSTGRVFTMGKSEYNGHASAFDVVRPTALPLFDTQPARQVSVASGGFHTLVLTTNNKIYTWGHNRVGQLGLTLAMVPSMPRTEDGGYFVATPTMVSYLPSNVHIQSVHAGWGHSFLLTTDQTVLVCGRNVEGQLGLSPDKHTLPVNERGHRFQPLYTNLDAESLWRRKISQVSCGGEYSIIVCADNAIYGTGNTSFGQLGVLQEDLSYSTPVPLPHYNPENREVLAVSTGFYCSAVLLGARVVPSLRNLCSEALRRDPHLWPRLRDAPNEVTQSSSRSDAMMDGEEGRDMDMSEDYLDIVRGHLV